MQPYIKKYLKMQEVAQKRLSLYREGVEEGGAGEPLGGEGSFEKKLPSIIVYILLVSCAY